MSKTKKHSSKVLTVHRNTAKTSGAKLDIVKFSNSSAAEVRELDIITLMLRQAEVSDYEAIMGIRGSVALDIERLDDPQYRVDIQRQGFLLPKFLSRNDFEENLSNYSISEQAGKAIGYLCLSGHQVMEANEPAYWIDPALQEAYYSSPHAYLCGIVALRGVGRKGIGQELLQTAERQAYARNTPWLFSMIVVSPVTNVASMMFHEKNGFERAALLEPTEFLGMKGFQNLLYGKRLS